MRPPVLRQAPSWTTPRKVAPEMPRIPGVNDVPKPSRLEPKLLIAVILGALLGVLGFAFWRSHARRSASNISAPIEAATPRPFVPPRPTPIKPDTETDVISTIAELAKPWSSKRFNFIDPNTHENVAAEVIHLPGSSESFWAFSLNTPFSRCQLQYVTDLNALSRRFVFAASHPMVVNDCDGILYDPLKMATLPDGSWVHGDIVRGGGIRPPVAISVHVHDGKLIADRIE